MFCGIPTDWNVEMVIKGVLIGQYQECGISTFLSEHEKVIKDAFNGTVHTHTRNGIHSNWNAEN